MLDPERLVDGANESTTLADSYQQCRRIARGAASNFSYPMLLLPRAKRHSMYALYAFLRRCDDISDSEASLQQRRDALGQWRESLEQALLGECHDPILPALIDTVSRYRITPQYLFDVLDGGETDLESHHFETFEQLERYCYQVASVVGLACIHIWGFHGDGALKPACQCGVAFQMTNILRDLKEDAQRGRIYLPSNDLRRFEYAPDDLCKGMQNEPFRRLMEFEIDRTEQFYEEALPLVHYLHADGRRVFRAMVAIYRALLDEIKRHQGDVFSRRIQVGSWKKLWIAGSLLLS